MLLSAEHNIIEANQIDTKNVLLKSIRTIEMAWLFVRQGRYSDAEILLEPMQDRVDHVAREMMEWVFKAIKEIKAQRRAILEAMPKG